MKVLIDTDFLTELLDRRSEDDPIEIFERLMSELDYEPIMIPYVARVELEYNDLAQQLINKGSIEVVEYSSFLSKEDMYDFEEKVWFLVEEMAEDDIKRPSGRSIFQPNFSFKTHNMGEIISELAANEMQVPYFASNDFGAKHLAKRHFNRDNYTLHVYNLYEMISQLNPEATSFAWSDIKLMLRKERWKNNRTELRKRWMKE